MKFHGTLSGTGDVFAGRFYGDGSGLTNLPTTLSTNIRSGKSPLLIDAYRQSVNFSPILPNDDYTLTVSIINNVDKPVSVYVYTITDTTISGFNIEFSGAIDSNNFVVHWIAIL